MIKIKTLLLPVLGLTVHLPLMSQNTNINFIVKDQVTGFGIPGSIIQMKAPDGNTSTLTTAADGRLLLPAQKGRYSFVIAASGYQSLETFFVAGNDSSIEANINLDPDNGNAYKDISTLRIRRNQVILNGYIRDADKNIPLGGVQISAGSQTTVTNSKGFFSLPLTTPAKEPAPGTVPDKISIRAVKAGFVPYVIDNFYLIPDSYVIKIPLSATTSAKWKARMQQPAEETEYRTHGLLNRTAADDQQRYNATDLSNVPAGTEVPNVMPAAAVPSSIRVGTSCSCTRCSVVQVMSLESYTQSGLDDEWIASWGAASLQAGAVAYRSYGAWYVRHPVAGSYDIAATTCNQVWQSDISTRTKNAAIATAGTVLIKNSAIFRSEYSAENNNSGCGNGYSGTGSTWPCISDTRCAGRKKNGHGRGMCQWGSSFWARDKSYLWILNHYYNPGSVFVQLPPSPVVTAIELPVNNPGTGTDTDGQKNTAATLRLSPNPANGNQVKVACTSGQAQQATVILLDNYGRAIRTQQVTLQAGYNRWSFYTGKLKAGIYTITISFTTTGKTESSTLVVP